MGDAPVVGPLHQVAQRADDLDASVAFYTEVLGLPLIARFDPPGLAFVALGDTRLLLERTTSSATLYLRVDDIHDAYRRLEERGVVFESEPHLIHRDEDATFGPAGQEEWMAFFRDPAGNVVALAARQ